MPAPDPAEICAQLGLELSDLHTVHDDKIVIYAHIDKFREDVGGH